MQDKEGMHQYTYDGHNWLLSAAYPDGTSETFAYDPVGNRTNRLHVTPSSTGQTVYHYGTGNRLLSTVEGGQTNHYSYDDIGRLTNQTVGGETQAYGYDFLSRMTQLVDTNGSVFAYAFDGEGNRTKQALNDCLETRFVYDGNNVVLELNANNEPVQAYVNNLRIDQPLERISFVNGTPRQWRTFHRDALGSVVGLSDENGALVQSYAYAAFGAIRTQSGADLNRITYTAREALGDSAGLYYYRFRTYGPALGRFLSEDPLGFIDGPNRYIYVRNSPVTFRDPFGLVIENNSDCLVFFKPEHGVKVDAVPPQGTYYGEHDGVIEPATGDVYKTFGKFGINDNIVIDSGGKVRGLAPGSRRVGDEFLFGRHSRSDFGWDELFMFSYFSKGFLCP